MFFWRNLLVGSSIKIENGEDKPSEDKSIFEKAKETGGYLRIAHELSKGILKGDDLYHEARLNSFRLTNLFEYPPALAGFIVGYARSKITIQTSSLSWEEVRDTPLFLLSDPDQENRE